jgi:hypothetical protein
VIDSSYRLLTGLEEHLLLKGMRENVEFQIEDLLKKNVLSKSGRPKQLECLIPR